MNMRKQQPQPPTRLITVERDDEDHHHVKRGKVKRTSSGSNGPIKRGSDHAKDKKPSMVKRTKSLPKNNVNNSNNNNNVSSNNTDQRRPSFSKGGGSAHNKSSTKNRVKIQKSRSLPKTERTSENHTTWLRHGGDDSGNKNTNSAPASRSAPRRTKSASVTKASLTNLNNINNMAANLHRGSGKDSNHNKAPASDRRSSMGNIGKDGNHNKTPTSNRRGSMGNIGKDSNHNKASASNRRSSMGNIGKDSSHNKTPASNRRGSMGNIGKGSNHNTTPASSRRSSIGSIPTNGNAHSQSNNMKPSSTYRRSSIGSTPTQDQSQNSMKPSSTHRRSSVGCKIPPKVLPGRTKSLPYSGKKVIHRPPSQNINNSNHKSTDQHGISQGSAHSQSKSKPTFDLPRRTKSFPYKPKPNNVTACTRQPASQDNADNPNKSNDIPKNSQRSQGKNNHSKDIGRQNQHGQTHIQHKSTASTNIEKHMQERKKKIALKKARTEDEKEKIKKTKEKKSGFRKLTSREKKKKARLSKKGEGDALKSKGFFKIKFTDADRYMKKKVPKKKVSPAEKRNKLTKKRILKKKGLRSPPPNKSSGDKNIPKRNGMGRSKRRIMPVRTESKKRISESQPSAQGEVIERLIAEYLINDGIRVTAGDADDGIRVTSGVDPKAIDDKQPTQSPRDREPAGGQEGHKPPISSINIMGDDCQKPVSELRLVGMEDYQISEKPIPSVRVIRSSEKNVGNEEKLSSIRVTGSSDEVQNKVKPSSIRITGSNDDTENNNDNKDKTAKSTEKNERSFHAIDWDSNPNLDQSLEEDDVDSDDVESVTPPELRSEEALKSGNSEEGVEHSEEEEDILYDSSEDEVTDEEENDEFAEDGYSDSDVESESEEEDEEEEDDHHELQRSFLAPLPTFEKRSKFYEEEYGDYEDEQYEDEQYEDEHYEDEHYEGDDYEDDDYEDEHYEEEHEDEESAYEFQPSDFDICFEAPEHPGTRKFLRAINHAYSKHGDVFFSRTVYKTIQSALIGRNFYIWKDEEETEDGTYGWTEASPKEILYHMSMEFEDAKCQ